MKRWHISHRIKLLDFGGNPYDVGVELEGRSGVGGQHRPHKILCMGMCVTRQLLNRNSFAISATLALLLLLLFIMHKNAAQKKHTSYKYSIQVKQTKKDKCNQL